MKVLTQAGTVRKSLNQMLSIHRKQKFPGMLKYHFTAQTLYQTIHFIKRSISFEDVKQKRERKNDTFTTLHTEAKIM